IDGLLSPDERQQNHEEIFSTLMELPEATLSAQAESAITSDVRGWLSLAAMAKRYQNNPLEQLTQLSRWKQLWSGHPAAAQLPKSLQMLSQVVAQRPKVIALLLPLQGDLGPYGRAIRDGILAAHYGVQGDTEIRVYDTTQADITQLLDQARADGAELAIGPLARDKVTTLARGGKLPIPVLALNRTLDGSINPDLYQFGLAPEDEDDQVADEVFREGKRNALVIYPAGEWGTRNFDAFKQRWTSLGGNIIKATQYSVQRDYSDMIKDVLDVDQSEDRANQLRRIIGQRFEFTPRRRQDIDFVFLLANPVEARKINPTLAFYYADDIPVYATSHINEGDSSKINSIDLNGIRFCDLPWKLTNTGPLQQQVEQIWPAAKKSLAAFYALGIDAYHLYPRLQQIKEVPSDRLFGNTGILQLRSDNVVTRTLMWARFTDGQAVSMPMIYGS
ncbi:MAG TPA: penicillin-binding protein activator, partial [Pseudomonadales bacterium]|nr:penicillin-binding protein activator [Pseudomonadales bacterium]